MKYLTSHYDSVLNQHYDLYLVKPKELRERIIQTYEKKIPDIEKNIHLFNADIKLFEKTLKIKQIEQGIATNYQYGYVHEDECFTLDGTTILLAEKKEATNTLQETEEELELELESIKNKAFATNKVKTSAKLGYELMPIAVSVPNKEVSNKEAEIELLDGFRRMFYTNDVPDNEVLVKVYDTLNDRDWINAMILYNSWKFANSQGSQNYLDRGFRLGLYYRYGIDFAELGLHEYDRPFSIINLFASKYPYSTFFNNDQTSKDLILIMSIMNYRPTFKKIKRKQMEEISTIQAQNRAPYPLGIMNEFIVREIGEFRREEFARAEKGELLPRKELSMEVIETFYADENLQKCFVKLMSMEVGGYIENHIRKNILPDLKKHIRV